MIYFDTETCGLHGPIVLLQYAYDDGPIELYHVWKEPIQKTLGLIEDFCYHREGVCGFNLAFDWFHICQTYTTLLLLKDQVGADQLPQDHITKYAYCEKDARFGPCLKPQTALDLMLHARKGPYQSLMNRGDITVKKIPTVLAQDLADELDHRIPFKDIYFARKENPKQRWTVQDIEIDGEIDPEFKNIVLKFSPSSSLKALAVDALEIDEKDLLKFSDAEPPKSSMPEELGYAPFALAIGQKGNWRGAWPDYGKIRVHIDHWYYNDRAKQYAEDDVKYTRDLHKFFSPVESGDDDSILACMVATVRWRGFKIDIEGIQKLRKECIEATQKLHFNFKSPEVCRRYITQVMSDVEKLAMKVDGKITTSGIVLEKIAKWKKAEVCDDCMGEGCNKCQEGLIETDERHPAAIRASEILSARRAVKAIELYDKLLKAGRFHASFKVIGTKSSRMSGADGLNPQGINRSKVVRKCFPLADDGEDLGSGDFDGYEVTIMIAVYHDERLEKDYLGYRDCHECKGQGCKECDGTGRLPQKLYAIAGEMFFPGKSYDQIMATKGLPNELDLYDRSKKGVLAIFYGGEGYTLSIRVGIPEEIGDQAFNKWLRRYPDWAAARKEIHQKFCSMQQPNGIGTKVEWREPAEYIESLLGFKRYFTLENWVCKTLFELAENPPRSWINIPMKVTRRDRVQTASGAARSALFAAAFAIQASNMRAAANHVIQSTGGEITKKVQRRVWDIQPAGIGTFLVRPFNVHDEINNVSDPSVTQQVQETVNQTVEECKQMIPLLKMDWKSQISTWADK